MTEVKLRELKETYPEADESILLEILISCNGSLPISRSLLDESFPNQRRSLKYKPSTHRQTTINRLIANDSMNDHVFKSTNTTNSNRPVHLYTKDDIENTLQYATIHHNFLPKKIADSLLTHIMNDNEGFSPQEFHLFGNKCVSNHLNKLYSLNSQNGIFYNGVKSNHGNVYTDDMKISQVLIEDQVNLEISQRSKLPFQSNEPWKGEIAVCNKFIDRSNNLDWHSDRMTYIGPHCTIASLTLGASREFRVKRQYSDPNTRFNTIYSVPLPHNTLLIMHSGFQEEYKHSVSSTTEIESHKISGQMRINLTYRHYLPRYRDHLPMCNRCGSQMDLRRSFKDPKVRGRYIWLCTGGYLGKECNGFHWANFKDESLFTDDPDDCSIWIAREDREALKCFRETMNERLNNTELS